MTSKDAKLKIAVVTGVSEGGIGYHLSLALLRRGYRVYGTVRTPGKEGALSENANFKMLVMDVDSSDSIRKAKEEFLTKEKHLDLLICNAGCGGSHIMMDLPEQEAQAMFSTNVMGVLLTCQIFGMILATQGYGTIVNVSSMAGHITLPWQGMYNATKAACVAITTQLRWELGPLGVKVINLAPAKVSTHFTSKLVWPDERNSPSYSLYEKESMNTSMGAFKDMVMKEGVSANAIAEQVLAQIEKFSPPHTIMVGEGATTVKWMLSFAPTWLLEWLLKDATKFHQLRRGASGVRTA